MKTKKKERKKERKKMKHDRTAIKDKQRQSPKR
jgi:hypothetical protein